MFDFNRLAVGVKGLFMGLTSWKVRGLWRAIALAAVLGLAPPVSAQDPDCLATPTRACVLDMAIGLAERSEDRFAAAQGLLTVAVLREALGREGADAALSRFVDVVRHDNEGQPDLAVFQFSSLLVAQDYAGFPVAFSDWQAAAPKAMTRLAAVVSKTGREMSGEGAKIRDMVAANLLGLAGAIGELETLLATREAAGLADVVAYGALGLLSRRDFAGAEQFALSQADPAIEAAVRKMTIERRKGLGDFAEALALIELHADPHERARELARLALNMSWQGELEAARAVTVRPDLKAAANAYVDIAQRLAEVHANLGDRAKVTAFTETLRDVASESTRRYLEAEAPRLEAVAALVAGEDARFLELAREADGDAAEELVWWSANAALSAGRRDLDEVMEALPVSLRYVGLSLVAYHQAEAGELEAALATLDRLQVLVGPHLYVESDPRFAIAPLLAKRGRGSEAVQMALDVGDAALLASLAVDLPE